MHHGGLSDYKEKSQSFYGLEQWKEYGGMYLGA